MNGHWQPAITAPYHLRILVASDCGSVVICERTTGGWVVEGTIHYGDRVAGVFLITHWMQLPSAPGEANE